VSNSEHNKCSFFYTPQNDTFISFFATMADADTLSKARAAVKEFTETQTFAETMATLNHNIKVREQFAPQMQNPDAYNEHMYDSLGMAVPESQWSALEATIVDLSLEEQAQYADRVSRAMAKDRVVLEKLRPLSSSLRASGRILANLAYMTLHCPFEDFRQALRLEHLRIDLAMRTVPRSTDVKME
jgi:hypothetical protein